MTTIAHGIPTHESDALARVVREAVGATMIPSSLTRTDDAVFALARRGLEKLLIVVADSSATAGAFIGTRVGNPLPNATAVMQVCPLTHANAVALRQQLPFTASRPLGLHKSIGMGDRLGIATPGHIQAIRAGSLQPVLAQQSVREMTRSRRSAEQVLDDATWGVLQTGFDAGYGADADHLKTTDDIDVCVKAGFTMFTVDPSDHVDVSAETASAAELVDRYQALPWDTLQISSRDCRRAYHDKAITLATGEGPVTLRITADDLLLIAVKYGRAVAHAATMYAYLASVLRPGSFDFEVSVDETAAPTSAIEHYYVAAELRRLGVTWTSLAPRLPGRFEKGVDYIGDRAELRAALAEHMAIARAFRPYKLSLHSGSDKFSVYPIVAEVCGDLMHIKTAGTSYLEALRTLAIAEPAFFREILAFSRERYAEDRATYEVSAEVARGADPERLDDAELPGTLDDFHTRQICHVTYGSVLTATAANGRPRFRDRFLGRLRKQEELYTRLLESHFRRHTAPFR